ncbi:MAG: ABC transporter ATP-binding protein/permease [Clostridia bacterium]|nr:ABC transporter ATP-binding protein/permease [Clostridia bacterium]
MLKLKNIVKKYVTGDSEVLALGGVSLNFRRNEFVSILGASGCGKTTMLNLIGGLDRYTDGDLIINGKSTKEFLDRDWDHYRNHSVGFVFQNYNLIPHQSVLSNVELALTLSGVSKAERRERAAEALAKVGLGDQLGKRPSQMSGGQMQRVAIARALVNNPDILLADEPTGALDTTTSVQIMELLKEVARDRLVIMVTHNPELAEEYSTRIVRLRDGLVVDDSDPFEGEPMPVIEEAPTELDKIEKKQAKKNAKKKAKKNSMSFLTALSLSKNNLMTKKGRTILTSFAGSIGIIGIALILSISNGIQGYIDQIQEDTLSTYPLSINKTETDLSAMMSAMTETSQMQIENPDPNTIYVDDSLGTMMAAMSSTVENDLRSFKAYIDANYAKIADSVSDIQYTYDFDLQIYTADGKTRVNPTEILKHIDAFAGLDDMMSGMGGSMSIFSEMINNQELLEQQYELIGEGSHWPTKANEVVLVVGKNNQISAMTLYMLGVLPQDELNDVMNDLMQNGEYNSRHNMEYSLDDFLGMEFYMLTSSDFYTKIDDYYYIDGKPYHKWQDMREYGYGSSSQEAFVTENGTKLTISGIIRPKPGVSATSISGAIGYTKALTDQVLQQISESEIIQQQKDTPNHNVLDGAKFERVKYTKETLPELVKRVGSTNMEKFYSMATAMIFTNPEFSSQLVVKPEAFSFFLAMMEEKQQNEMVEKMLANAISIHTKEGVDTVLKSLPVLPATILNTENLIALLPSISDVANEEGISPKMMVFGTMQGCCDPAYIQTLCNEIQADLPNWRLNDKSFMLLTQMGFLDENFEMVEEMLYDLVPTKDATLESNLKLLGAAETADPMSIHFYAKDFESKGKIEAFIQEYNDGVDDDKKIEYTDLMGILMSSISIIIDVISYVLIAFVSISLIVSSIMIGIITYISVLERTKEIGILRSIGASKKDISRVFNAETLIVGFVAGLIGILATILLCLPINAIIRALSGVEGVRASLPVGAAIILVAISMFLTFIAGLIPSRLASKKDPVEALRSE